VLGVNCYEETWAFESPKDAVSAAVVEVLGALTDKQKARLLMPNFQVIFIGLVSAA
jgi:hypothetical protein